MLCFVIPTFEDWLNMYSLLVLRFIVTILLHVHFQNKTKLIAHWKQVLDFIDNFAHKFLIDIRSLFNSSVTGKHNKKVYFGEVMLLRFWQNCHITNLKALKLLLCIAAAAGRDYNYVCCTRDNIFKCVFSAVQIGTENYPTQGKYINRCTTSF